jgi:hypothetical protein
MPGPGPCNGGGMTAGPGGGGAGGAPTCSCQGGCSGDNGGGNSGNNGGGYPPPCRHGQGPEQPPTSGNVHHLWLLGVRYLSGPDITCNETGVTQAALCRAATEFYFTGSDPKSYRTQGGRGFDCPPGPMFPCVPGTLGSGSGTGTNPGDTVIISVSFTPD